MSHQLDLPIARKLPPWLPDETLFSWCSRFHMFAVNGLASSTCLQLFGHRTTGAAHDMPCRIDVLVSRTRSQLGNAQYILSNRTLLSFYLAFKPEFRVMEVIKLLRGPDASRVKYRLGLLTGGLPADHPLKACLVCMESDRREFGLAYWHRTHQLPTAFVCSKHELPLMVSPMKVRQVARFQWVLPYQAYLTKAWSAEDDVIARREMHCLLRLAKMSECAMELAPSSLVDEHRLAMTFRHRLQSMGLISASGRIVWDKLLREVKRRLAPLQDFHGMGLALSTACSAQPALTRMLGGRTLMHPCRYMGWALAFFEDWQDFMWSHGGHCQNQARAFIEPAEVAGRVIGSQVRIRAVEMLLQGNQSLTAVARELQIDYQTVAAWAAQHGIFPKRRAKHLKGDAFQMMINGLEAGEDKERIASQCGVAVGTVTRIMRTEPGLSERWHQVRWDRARDGARARWSELTEGAGSLGVKALRRINPGDYAWLYRNDRDWLMACNDRLIRPMQRGNHADARRARRDAQLAKRIRLVALRLSLTERRYVPTFDSLVKALPELLIRIKNANQWPLTSIAIKEIYSARTSSSSDELPS